jgi:hypothetical protein
MVAGDYLYGRKIIEVVSKRIQSDTAIYTIRAIICTIDSAANQPCALDGCISFNMQPTRTSAYCETTYVDYKEAGNIILLSPIPKRQLFLVRYPDMEIALHSVELGDTVSLYRDSASAHAEKYKIMLRPQSEGFSCLYICDSLEKDSATISGTSIPIYKFWLLRQNQCKMFYFSPSVGYIGRHDVAPIVDMVEFYDESLYYYDLSNSSIKHGNNYYPKPSYLGKPSYYRLNGTKMSYIRNLSYKGVVIKSYSEANFGELILY